MSTKYIIFGCVLLLVLLLTMGSACGVLPYSATTRSYAIVEGAETQAEFNESINKLLDDLEKLSADDEETKTKIKEIRDSGIDGYNLIKLKTDLEGLATDESSAIYKRIRKFIEEKISTPEEPTAPPEEPPSEPKVEGFEGFNAMSGSIDIFGSAVGNQSCVKTASGLSNSMGALCLSADQLHMLQTRGGNSTGRDSQIGS